MLGAVLASALLVALRLRSLAPLAPRTAPVASGRASPPAERALPPPRRGAYWPDGPPAAVLGVTLPRLIVRTGRPNQKEIHHVASKRNPAAFHAIQQTISDAEQAVDAADAPDELRECIQKMADASPAGQGRHAVERPARMVECIDSLEDMGDEAKRISRSDDHIAGQLETAVTRVHAELSKLKHQLH